MADQGKGYWGWDPTTPANNGTNDTTGGINIGENATAPSAVNNAMRGEMLRFAQYLQEQGFPTAGGTANALTLTPNNVINAYANGMYYGFKGASANTTASTLNVSAVGVKAIRKIVGGTDVALAANDIQANGRYTVVYDTAANSAAGAWIITGPSSLSGTYLPLAGGTLTGDETISKSNPTLTLNKGASGQDNQIFGQTAGLSRWGVDLGNSTSESGTNAGSDFFIYRYDDAGSFIEQALKITRSSGLFVVQRVLDLSAATAGQIIFPATQNASAGANTLDDYEEGTWTPGVSFGNGTTGITYSNQSGTYIKIGQLVMAFFTLIQLTSKGSSTGSARLTGLPFTANGDGFGLLKFYGSMSGFTGGAILNINAGTTAATFTATGAAAVSDYNDSNFTNTSVLVGACYYRATA